MPRLTLCSKASPTGRGEAAALGFCRRRWYSPATRARSVRQAPAPLPPRPAQGRRGPGPVRTEPPTPPRRVGAAAAAVITITPLWIVDVMRVALPAVQSIAAVGAYQQALQQVACSGSLLP